MPTRIQRRRTRGWRMPEGAVYVGRPTKWGNPYREGDESAWFGDMPVFGIEEPITSRIAVDLFRMYVIAPASPISWAQIRTELAGKDLACWCPLDQPCHADVLLEVANAGEGSP